MLEGSGWAGPKSMSKPAQLATGQDCHLVWSRRPDVGLARKLFKLARITKDIEVITSGQPDRIMRRAKNRLIWSLLNRNRWWRSIWR